MGWYSSNIGIGTTTHSTQGTTYVRRSMIGRYVLESLYRQCGVARKIVARMPFDAIREGWDRYEGVLDETGSRALLREERRLRLRQLLHDALVWERLYGGSAIILSIDDGGESWEPLVEDRVREIRSAYVAHRWELWPHTYFRDTDSPDDGVPEIWAVRRDLSTETVLVHRSRMLLFTGETLDGLSRQENWGWGDSILEQVWEEVRNAGISDAGVIEYLLQLSVPVLKVKKWWELLAGKDGESRAETMLESFRRRLSMFRLLVLDSEDDAQRVSAAVSGIADLLEHQKAQVAAVSDYPQTLLYGRSPAGENATGASDLELYYGIVRARIQEGKLREPLERIYSLLVRAPIWGAGEESNPLPADVQDAEPDIEFHPLWLPSDKEQAETEEIRARTRTSYASLGWVDPDEGRRLLATDGMIRPEDAEEEPVDVLPEGEREDAQEKRRFRWRGYTVRIEVQPGERRSFPGTRYPDILMPCAYGEVLGTVGLDGDPVDVLIYDQERDTVHAGTLHLTDEEGHLDEVKLILGAPDTSAAAALLSLVYGGGVVGDVVFLGDEDLKMFLPMHPQPEGA